jgi:hypothetical protein
LHPSTSQKAPHPFLRGAADLASQPPSGLIVQLCGDANPLIVGVYASAEQQLRFDLKAFDATLARPCSGG